MAGATREGVRHQVGGAVLHVEVVGDLDFAAGASGGRPRGQGCGLIRSVGLCRVLTEGVVPRPRVRRGISRRVEVPGPARRILGIAVPGIPVGVGTAVPVDRAGASLIPVEGIRAGLRIHMLGAAVALREIPVVVAVQPLAAVGIGRRLRYDRAALFGHDGDRAVARVGDRVDLGSGGRGTGGEGDGLGIAARGVHPTVDAVRGAGAVRGGPGLAVTTTLAVRVAVEDLPVPSGGPTRGLHTHPIRAPLPGLRLQLPWERPVFRLLRNHEPPSLAASKERP